MSPRPIGVPDEICTSRPVSRRVSGTCSEMSRPSRSQGFSAATASTSPIGVGSVAYGWNSVALEDLVHLDFSRR